MGNSIQAYVLMDIEIGQLDKVVEKLRLIQEANKIAVVTGHYDIIMRLQVESLERTLRYHYPKNPYDTRN